MAQSIPDRSKMIHLGNHSYRQGNKVYKFTYRDNPDTHIWYPYGSGDVVEEVLALERVKGLLGCQQLITFQDNVLSTEFIPGTNLDLHESGVLTAPAYSETQLTDLFRNLIEMGKRGVGYEQRPKNLLYDETIGFTVIDLEALNPTEDELFPNSSPDEPWIRTSAILSAISATDENTLDYVTDTTLRDWYKDDEKLANHYQRLLRAFHAADPAIAKSSLQRAYDPRCLPYRFFTSLDHISTGFKAIQEVLSSLYGLHLEDLVEQF